VDEKTLERAKARIAEAASGRIAPAELEAALERTRIQVESLAAAAAELEGTLPEIRATVMPAVIDDLTHSPQVRELMLEQGRGVVDQAAEHLRSSSAAADDRLESAFRRLVRAPAPGPGDDEPTAETPVTEPPADAPHGG